MSNILLNIEKYIRNRYSFMRNQNALTKVANSIEGKWLKETIDALGESISEVRRQMGLNYNNRLYQHFNNESHIGGGHLYALKKAYPSVNLNYVISGELPILLGPNGADAAKVDAMQRAVTILTEQLPGQ